MPSEFGNLASLTAIEVGANHIRGTIPSSLNSLRLLERLLLFGNSLTGSIPNLEGTNLTWIAIYDNSLTGTIPSSLGSLKFLSQLVLYGNSLEGIVILISILFLILKQI